MAAEALDMQWNMADAGKAATCSQCRGSRTFECRCVNSWLPCSTETEFAAFYSDMSPHIAFLVFVDSVTGLAGSR
jgi:hypothetical protein